MLLSRLPKGVLTTGKEILRHVLRRPVVGVAAAAQDAVAHLTRERVEGFLIHLDADCISDEQMPAVDYRLPGGLTFDDVAKVLRIALDSGKAVGLEVTIYNPSLDASGEAGRGLADALVKALSR